MKTIISVKTPQQTIKIGEGEHDTIDSLGNELGQLSPIINNILRSRGDLVISLVELVVVLEDK